MDFLGFILKIGGTGKQASVDASGITTGRTLTLPDKSGTLAVQHSFPLTLANGSTDTIPFGDQFPLWDASGAYNPIFCTRQNVIPFTNADGSTGNIPV